LNGFLLEIYEPIHHCSALIEPYPFPEQRKKGEAMREDQA
jgi:hypothetical protein